MYIRNLLIILTLSMSWPIFSQDLVLVSDYNQGGDNAFDNWNYESHTIGNDIFLPIKNAENGLELGIIKDGNLLLFMDLLQGPDSSEPRNFYDYKGITYFSAKNSDGWYETWQTDGTEAGTIKSLDLGVVSTSGPAQDYTESASGWLYYSFNNMLYRTDGDILENLGEKEFKSKFPTSVTSGLIPYKEEVAFIVEESQAAFIKTIQTDGSILTLMEYPYEFGTDIEAFLSLGDYFIFELEFFPQEELSGLYIFKDGETTPTREEFFPRLPIRYLKIDDNKLLCTVLSEGVYSMSATDNGIVVELELSGDGASFVQSEAMPSIIHKGKAVFVGTEASVNNGIVVTDMETLETEVAFTLKTHTTRFLRHNNFGFIVSGTSNGFQPIFYYYDFIKCEHGVIKELDESSRLTNSIRLVGVQGSLLYFISNLDESVGAELYYIDISSLENLQVNTEDAVELPLNLLLYENNFELIDNNNTEYQYIVRDIAGRLIDAGTGITNHRYPLIKYSGTVVFTLITENGYQSILKVLSE